MKANEAPEKIYLEKVYTDNGVLPNGLNYNQSPNDIEYVRTDAFIEKTLKWIDATFHGASVDGYGGESVDVVMSDTSVYKDDLFESYKNYMKGE